MRPYFSGILAGRDWFSFFCCFLVLGSQIVREIIPLCFLPAFFLPSRMDVTAPCGVRSHLAHALSCSERPGLQGVSFILCPNWFFGSSYRPGHGAGHVCGCALRISLRTQAGWRTPTFIDCFANVFELQHHICENIKNKLHLNMNELFIKLL